MRGTILEKFALPFYNFICYIDNGALALVEAFDEKLARLYLLADILADFWIGFCLRKKVFVVVTDSKVGHEIAVVGHLEVVAVLEDGDFWDHVLFNVALKFTSGMRIQSGNTFRSGLDVGDTSIESAGDFRETASAQGVKVIGKDAAFNAIHFADSFQLEHQTFAQTARRNTRRIESLYYF